MNIFTLFKLLGRSWIVRQIKSGLDHNVSAMGKGALATSLTEAGTALQAGNTTTAAQALADVLLSIH